MIRVGSREQGVVDYDFIIGNNRWHCRVTERRTGTEVAIWDDHGWEAGLNPNHRFLGNTKNAVQQTCDSLSEQFPVLVNKLRQDYLGS